MAQVRKDRVQVEVEINGQRKAGQTLAELRKQYRQINREIQQLTIGSDEYIKKMDEAKGIKKTLDEQRLSTRNLSQGMKDAGKESVNLIGRLKDVGKGFVAAFGPVALIFTAVQAIVSLTRETFAAQAELTKVNERINQLAGLSGNALRDATAQAQSLANVYEVDVLEAVNAANAATRAFIKEGEDLGEVYDENLGLIGDRLSAVNERGQEFLDQVSEYSVQARIAGIENERFFNLVAEGINRGIPTDKLLDSVKEFDIRIKTLTVGQRDTLKQVLGEQFAQELETSVLNGTKTSFEALNQVSERLLILGEDSAQARLLISDLFGGAGEDAAIFAEIIANTTGNLEDLTGATSVYSQRKRELAELEERANIALNELNFQLDGSSNALARTGVILRTVFYSALAQVAELFNYFPGYMNVALEGLKSFVNRGIESVETLLRYSLYPLINALERISGEEFQLGRLEVDTNAYNDLQVRIRQDREQFAADQAAQQQALEEAEQARLRAERARLQELSQARVEGLEKEYDQTEEVENRKFEIRKLGLEALESVEQEITARINQQEIDAQQVVENAKVDQARERAERIAEINREQAEREFEVQRDLNQQFYQAAIAVANVANDRIYFDKIDALEREKARELELVGDNEEKIKEIEEKFEAEKLRQERNRRNRQKAFDIAQVAINTAQSIVKTGAQLGYPAAIPFQIQAGIVGAIQAGVIAAQKFEKGGYLPQPGRGGITEGARHSQGGIKMYDSVSGRYVGEAEGGEVILSRNTYANNRDLVDALLFSSRFRRGERVYEQGGILAAANTTPSISSIESAAEFNDANIVRELRLLRQGVGSLQLKIGEREAASIGSMYDSYKSRLSQTLL